MSRGSARRRLRLRRRRKGETFSKILDVPDVVDIASGVDVADIVDAGAVADLVDGAAVADLVDGAAVAEVVGHMGCCVVEAVGSLAVVLVVLAVPAYVLMR